MTLLAQNPHHFFERHWTPLDFMWIGIVPNSAILFVDVAIHSEMGLIAKDDFLTKIRISFQLLQGLIGEHMFVVLDCHLPSASVSVEFYTGADPCHEAKFAKLRSAQAQVLVSDAKSTA